MERSTLDLWVGLFVIAGFAALTVLALKVGNMGSVSGGSTYQLSAQFTNIGGLKARAAVKSAVRCGGTSFVRRSASIYQRVHGHGNDDHRTAMFKFPKEVTSASITDRRSAGGEHVRGPRRRRRMRNAR
jgi:phospholipid/cholesterol/gamma-HCH transport system substrate-binding protein